jgi:hypothetical protein
MSACDIPTLITSVIRRINETIFMMKTSSSSNGSYFDPGGNCRLETLFAQYQKAESLEEREKVFKNVCLEVVPIIEWVSCKTNWLNTLGESDLNAIVNEFILKLPRVLAGYRSDSGFKLYSYLLRSIENTLRRSLRVKRNVEKHLTDWPLDDNGQHRDIEDRATSFVSHATNQERRNEVELLLMQIPDELALGLPQPYAGITRYVAERYLDRACNEERLYISELAEEVAKLPGHTLTPNQIKNLVRATIGGVRARLFQSDMVQDNSEMVSSETARELLSGLFQRGDCRLWPFLLILSPTQTVMLLRCVAGIVPSAPPHARWFRSACVNGDHRAQPTASIPPHPRNLFPQKIRTGAV